MAEPEQARGDQRARLIESVNRAMAATMEFDEVLGTGVRLLVPALGDVAVAVGPDGDAQRRIAVCHVDPARESGVRRLVERWLEPLERLASRSLESGRPFRWLPQVNAATALSATRGHPGLARMLEQSEVRSLMVVPLQNGRRSVGALAVARTGDEHPYTGAELALLQVVGRRVALATETARLYATMQEASWRQSHVEEALRKWTRVFHVAGWGAAVVDGPDRLIDVVNPAFAQLHGYDRPEDLAGRPFVDLLTVERRAEPDRWRPGAPGAGDTYESVHCRADGRAFPVLVSVTPLDSEGEQGSFVVTVQDLTDLKRAEERLRRAQRMEAVGRLAGGVAHEVNNMMTIILGFSDLLQRAPELPELFRRDVEEIRKAATRAGKITQQLLAFSRQQVLQPVDLRLNAIVGELTPVLRLLLPANVRVESRLSPIDAIVHADRAQLEQVLINLAFNARDAMPEGGTIRIGTETRYLSEDAGHRLIGVPFPPGEYALISVVDTGLGMDEATIEQVFEPFFTTKPLGLGTGLGLATVYGIVKQSGGYVWVESTPGEGTTFTVGLPLVDGVPVVEPESDVLAQPEPPGAGTVLVVEDEDGVRQLAGRVLSSRGYEVLEARNGQEAVAVMEQAGPVDLVVTDVVVPDVSIGDLARRLREAREGVPILYMSGYPQEDVVQRHLIGPEQPFLQKPFTGDELAEGVGRLMRGEQPVVEG